MRRVSRLFFLPGDLVADRLGLTAGDDRAMLRTLVDMLFWNAVVVTLAWVFFL